MSVRVVSARGVPGTAGPIASDATARYVLASHHVVLGGGALAGDRVFAVHPDDVFASEPVPLGRAARGQLGRVTFRGEAVFVDCALIALEAALPDWVREALDGATDVGEATPGLRVRKHGAVTGTTDGTVLDVAYSDRPHIDGQLHKAPGQLLVDSLDQALNFVAPGDSGAALLDESDRVIGLIWGDNGGRGVACPIGAVLDHLRVQLGAVWPRSRS